MVIFAIFCMMGALLLAARYMRALRRSNRMKEDKIQFARAFYRPRDWS